MACDVNDRLKDMNAELEFLIATLPDPILSHFALNFDGGLEAIVRAFKSQEYVMVRNHMPWNPKNPEAAKESPGLLMFRKSSPKKKAGSPKNEPTEMKHDYCCVVLVGETPTTGIHNGALRKALEFVVQWQSGVEVKSSTKDIIRIMGPFHSGSVPRLSQFLKSWKRKQSFRAIQIVSGSASATGNRSYFNPEDSVFFQSMAPTEEEMLEVVHKHLRERGIKKSQIALLTESDTTYGIDIVERGEKNLKGEKVDKKIKNQKVQKEQEVQGGLVITYPLSLARMRTELERAAIEQGESQVAAEIARHKNVTVKEEVSPSAIDVLPLFSKASTGSSELVLESLIAELSRGDIRAIGLMGTDVNDKLFLARRLRTVFPDIQFFTTRNNLLFTHSDYSAFMRGTIVAGCASLNPVSYDSNERDLPGMQQFSNDSVYGIYCATLNLLNSSWPDKVVPLSLSFSLVGEDAMWPLPIKISSSSTQPSKIQNPSSTIPPTFKSMLPAFLTSFIVVFVTWAFLHQTGREVFGMGNWLSLVEGSLSALQFVGLALVAGAIGLPSLICLYRGINAEDVASKWMCCLASLIPVWFSLSMIFVAVLVEWGLIHWISGTNSWRWFEITKWMIVAAVFLCSALLLSQGVSWVFSPERIDDTAHYVEMEWLRQRTAVLSNQVNPAIPVACLGGLLLAFALGLKRSVALCWQGQDHVSKIPWLGGLSVDAWVRVIGPLATLLPAATEKKFKQAHSSGCVENPLEADRKYVQQLLGRDYLVWLAAPLRCTSKDLFSSQGLVVVVFLLLCFWTWQKSTPTVEGVMFDTLVVILFCACGTGVLLLLFRLEALIREMDRIFRAISRTKIVDAFTDVPSRLREKVANQILCQRPDQEDLGLVVEMIQQGGAAHLTSDVEGEVIKRLDKLAKWKKLERRDVARIRSGELSVGSEAIDGEKKARRVRVNTAVVASLITIRIRELFWNVRNLATVCVIALMLLFTAIISYPFQTDGMLRLTWGLLFGWGLYILIKAILGFNKSETLSVLANTVPNRLTFDRTLVMPMLQYVLMPVIAVVTLATPSTGRWLGSLLSGLTSIMHFGGS
jgi:hypothetical protein